MIPVSYAILAAILSFISGMGAACCFAMWLLGSVRMPTNRDKPKRLPYKISGMLRDVDNDVAAAGAELQPLYHGDTHDAKNLATRALYCLTEARRKIGSIFALGTEPDENGDAK